MRSSSADGGARARASLRATTIALSLLLCAAAGGSRAWSDRPRVYVLTGARIITAPGQVISNGTLVVRDGLIEAVGSDIKAPSDAYLIDVTGRTITAGFLDACSDIGQKKAEGGGGL